MAANPISGPYTGVPASLYHIDAGKYNRVVSVTASFIATGSYGKPSAFYVSGSGAVTVTLINGGAITIPAPAAATPAVIYEMSVYSVDAGSVYLLYK